MLLARYYKDKNIRQTLYDHVDALRRSVALRCSIIGMEMTGELCALMHDFGKALSEWQDYLLQERSKTEKMDHSSAGAQYIASLHEPNMTYMGLAVQIIDMVICGHHGGMRNVLALDGKDILAERLTAKSLTVLEEAIESYFSEISSEEEIAELLKGSGNEMMLMLKRINEMPRVSSENNKLNDDFLFTLGLLARYILSCLVDADRWDAYLAEKEGDIMQSETAVDWAKLSEKLEAHLASLGKSNQPDEIKRARQIISDSCGNHPKSENGIYRLNAPTGSGKTLAAFRFALKHVKKDGQIFYIAPFKTILEQNASDIKKIFGKDAVFEHHSDIIERDENYEALSERWTPSIVFTTMIQFLDTLFCSSNTCVRRFNRLANSVIIIDEVQSVPLECTYMLNLTLRFLAFLCGSTILLVTATQPPLDEIPNHALPGPKDVAPNLREVFRKLRNITIDNRSEEPAYLTDALAELINERTHKDKTVLAIVNTKSAAKRLYEAVKQNIGRRSSYAVFLLTANMCPEHRFNRLEDIRARLSGKLPTICISTQLIEAGIDISYETVIRSLAGLNSIAQAAGRCNRGNEYGHGTVILLKYEAENLEKLRYIVEGQRAAQETLEAFKRNPEQFSFDLFSDAAVKRYYQSLYRNNTEYMGFPVMEDGKEVFLFDLLSRNSPAVCALSEKDKVPTYMLNQAFKTAGDLFNVIEKEGTTVLVPYREGENIIKMLYSSVSISDKLNAIHTAQRYCIEVRNWERMLLERYNMIHFLPELGVWVMDKAAYSDETGLQLVKPEGKDIYI